MSAGNMYGNAWGFTPDLDKIQIKLSDRQIIAQVFIKKFEK